MLVGDTWVTAPHLASALGLTREIIYNNLDLFTTRQGDDYNAPHQVKVDKRVQQFIDERYLGVKVI